VDNFFGGFEEHEMEFYKTDVNDQSKVTTGLVSIPTFSIKEEADVKGTPKTIRVFDGKDLKEESD